MRPVLPCLCFLQDTHATVSPLSVPSDSRRPMCALFGFCCPLQFGSSENDLIRFNESTYIRKHVVSRQRVIWSFQSAVSLLHTPYFYPWLDRVEQPIDVSSRSFMARNSFAPVCDRFYWPNTNLATISKATTHEHSPCDVMHSPFYVTQPHRSIIYLTFAQQPAPQMCLSTEPLALRVGWTFHPRRSRDRSNRSGRQQARGFESGQWSLPPRSNTTSPR